MLNDLADHLEGQQEAIIGRWMQACESDDALGPVSKLTREEFRNNMPGALEGLSRVLREGEDEAASKTIEAEVARHGHHRWKQGFSLKQLIRDWGKLNRVLVRVFEAFFHDNAIEDGGRGVAHDRLAAFVTEATTSSVWRFDELRRAEAATLTRDLEATRRRFDRLTQARGRMLREAAHDIRNSLSAVAMASNAVKSSARPNESLDDVLDMLDRGVESVREMLDSLLDLSRLESGAEEAELLSVDVVEVFENLAQEHRAEAEEKGLDLKTEGPAELLTRTDPGMVRRIAENLLVNALEHTIHGEVRLSWALQDRRWVLQVMDTGPGIQDVVGSPVSRELNDPDRSEPYDAGEEGVHRGEGIGLTIVKRLCDLLDAGITLESEMGRGTTFTVEFPLEGEAST